jgi:hypothetical protein
MHNKEEIKNAALNKIRNKSYTQNIIKVSIALKYEPDGVVYGYDVTLVKIFSNSDYTWDYKTHIRTL